MTNKTEYNTPLIEVEISAGIEKFLQKHGFTTDYQCQKTCGLSAGNVAMIRKNGGLSVKTLHKLGEGVGYKGNISQVCSKVLKDFL